MKTRNILSLITIGILILAIAIFTNKEFKEAKETDFKNTELETPEPVNIKPGSVYFKELYAEYDIKRFYYNTAACYGYYLLYYNGRIYTSSSLNTSSGSSNDKDQPDTEMLSKVYGNNTICWSEDSSMLTSVTEEGGIYKVDGYSEEDRICLFCKKEAESFQKRRCKWNKNPVGNIS